MEHSAESIKKEIYTVIQEDSSDSSNPEWNKWHIGLTIYPNQEKSDRGKPSNWQSWKAATPADAQNIESYFKNKYPINGNDSSGKYDYFVYIYME